MSRAYVLLSGGIDSTTCLAIACKQFSGSVRGVSFNYGQRHTKEIEHARMVCESFGITHEVLSARGLIAKGGLTDEGLEMPNVSYDELPRGMSPTYVPFRNGTMLAVLTSHATIDEECEAIFFGAHADDAANWAYPDCTPEFIGGMANAIYIGTYHKIRLYTPLIFMDKAGVIREGDRHNVPWELTWSCYEGATLHCGVCPTCRSRHEGFVTAGVVDPTEYAQPFDDVPF